MRGSDLSATRSVEELKALAEAAEYGARATTGTEGRIVNAIALCWALFQLWFASPLPYAFGIGILNDTEARMIHLAFALFLAFAISPMRKHDTSPVPKVDWLLGLAGAAAALFGLVFYQALAMRAGQPLVSDIVVAFAGLILVFEATRRSMGPVLVVVAIVFLFYSYLGPYMPAVLQHHGASFTRIMEHQWLASEGLFGVPLGASTGFVFIFVLFGTMFNRAGAGNYIMQLSLAFLGHLRGGPAKVAVVSSGVNGMISGSSIANVVASGIFTIPLMKRTGISGVKAGAIETAASIDGQIMPPVMGAAAFIMVEYVGLPYTELIRHAFLPAFISYLTLFYIVHLEAKKLGLTGLTRTRKVALGHRILRFAIGISGFTAVIGGLYHLVGIIQIALGDAAIYGLGALIAGLYVTSLLIVSRYPDLAPEDVDKVINDLPEGWEIARTGLHLLIPLLVLVWCLIIERMSPGLAAFWATVSVMAIMLTQEPIKRLARRQEVDPGILLAGAERITHAMVLAARNMVGIALSCATAGIIVGTVTLTGLGLMMTDAVAAASGGNIFFALILTALVTLILGCGVPTTANYVLVATLMAPVLVELGSEAGIAIPLVAIHLFVFYFGIMADSTPPVGLGAYAAAAVSGESPLATATQASLYSLRTGILAFIFIFNPELLLIGVTSIWHALLVGVASIAGCMTFAAATLGFWQVRSRAWETMLLLVVSLSLIYPAIWLDRFYDRYVERPPSALMQQIATTPPGERLIVRFEGISIEGENIQRTASLRLGKAGTPEERIGESGLVMRWQGDLPIVSLVEFGSYASRVKLEPGFRVAAVMAPVERPSANFVYVAASLLLLLVFLTQRRRMRREQPA